MFVHVSLYHPRKEGNILQVKIRLLSKGQGTDQVKKFSKLVSVHLDFEWSVYMHEGALDKISHSSITTISPPFRNPRENTGILFFLVYYIIMYVYNHMPPL